MCPKDEGSDQKMAGERERKTAATSTGCLGTEVSETMMAQEHGLRGLNRPSARRQPDAADASRGRYESLAASKHMQAKWQF